MNEDLIVFLENEIDEGISDYDYEEVDENNSIVYSRKLHTSRQDKAIVDLNRMMNTDEIVLSPSFQRKYVWTTKGASKFIESLLMNIPIPTIFVSMNKNGIWDVVDGQQRLTAIKQFYNNELQLTGLESLCELNKKRYQDLDDKTKKILNNRTLSVVIVDDDSSEEIKFDIFMRINQGSVKLNEQELRNCLYRGPFMDAIKKLGENEILAKILEKKSTFVDRFQHLEIIERFFSIREIINTENFVLDEGKYGGRITNNINSFLKQNQNLDNDSICKYLTLFEQTIEKVYMVFGDSSFRQYINGEYNYKINRAVAEMQLVILSFFDKTDIEKKHDLIRTKFEELMENDKKFEESFTRATNNTTVVNYRYNTWGTEVVKIINE